MTKSEFAVAKKLGIKQIQDKDLLLAVRAKAFELQTALSDLIEFGHADVPADWLTSAMDIYNQTGKRIKGA